jgi:LacI family transcriptional regulator
VGNPFAAAVHGGVEEVANTHRCLVLAASTHGDPDGERHLVYRMLGRRVDGLVIMSARTDHTYLTGELDRGLPIVFVDRPARGIRATSVVAANRAATREAVEHLIAHGPSADRIPQRLANPVHDGAAAPRLSRRAPRPGIAGPA